MQKSLRTSIIPTKQQFAKIKNEHQLDYEAICVFVTTGFFLDDNTFWKDEVCLKPGSLHTFDDKGFLISSLPDFEWYYKPQTLNLNQAVEAYQELLKEIISDQTKGQPVILPLSGGLDSRSQAMILNGLGANVHAFSYSFKNGYPEHKIAEQIASVCKFKFSPYVISEGYLWDSIEDLAQINGCYSEFTHPRQMAILDELKSMKGVFSLGHWGDVLFDRGIPEGVQEEEVLFLLFKKMVKPKGLELAIKLWEYWDIKGDFKDYLLGRIEASLNQIKIDNLSAKLRAYKTTQWAHRWTTTNLSVFEAAHPITLPFYDDRMCRFICEIPEDHLADRKIQLAHLSQNKALASITWQAQAPFSILNYKMNKLPYNLPFRIGNKIRREISSFYGHPYIQRNWELQFLGPSNEENLKGYIFQEQFLQFIPKDIVESVYSKFQQEDPIHYAHPLSMLLTLSLWNKKDNKVLP